MSNTVSQAHRTLALGTPLGEDVLLVASATLTERLGGLFSCELELFSHDEKIDSAKILGENVTLRAIDEDGSERFVNGHVARFVQLSADPGMAAERGERLNRYAATIVPRLWFLGRGADCRVFQNTSVPDIVKQVCNEAEMGEIELRLSGTYDPWDYCVQYRETTLNFLLRLLEQEGIYFFFKHDDGAHTLVLADSPAAHDVMPGHEQMTFRSEEGDDLTAGYVRSLVMQASVEPYDFALSDYDPTAPRKQLAASAAVDPKHLDIGQSVYDYPGEYIELERGERLAQVRLEEARCAAHVFRGRADVGALAAGFTFELHEHPREDANAGYLVTAVTTSLRSNLSRGLQGNDCQFTCIPADVAYRPTRSTPKPIAQGPQTAVVVGPSGKELHVDEFGRIKVQFHWDRYGEANENSSCWVRVSKPIAGKGWGFTAWPRIGQEVVVDFLDGDPDRPLVTGCVYNGVNTPPYELPGKATISTFKSNSSPGGGGFNEVRFEDKKGEEQVFIHAQKNFDTRVVNDSFENIGNNKHLIVTTDQREEIGVDLHQTIKRDHQEKIGRDRHTKVGGKQAEAIGGGMSLKVGQDLVEEVGMNHTEKVQMAWLVKAGMNAVIDAPMGITLKCGGNSIVLDPSGVTIKGTMLTLDGSMTRINSGPGSPPQQVQPGQLVSPAAPEAPDPADEADPGKVEEAKAEQRKAKKGKYGKVTAPPFVPPDGEAGGSQDQAAKEKEEKKDFIEIELLDEDGQPVAGEPYEITLPDGRVDSGTLDANGYARIDGIDPGKCQVRFPNRDVKDLLE